MVSNLQDGFADISNKPRPIVVIHTTGCEEDREVSRGADLDAMPVNYHHHTQTHCNIQTSQNPEN